MPGATPPQGRGGEAAPSAPAAQAAQGGRQGGRGAADRVNWDAPYIISPHSPRRLYWASNYVYRTDDRGDSWTRISPDLSRNLNRDELPIMGKLWPADSIARNTSTTPLSNVVSIDESPLLEGLLYVGTDDGLVQVTEDGGKNWRKIEQFPGVPQWSYVTDVFASPRDADTVFVTLNNWQRGDYKPYIVKSTDRGRTWTNISGNLPAKHDVWSILQDHVNGNLLFAGTEFGVFASVDGGQQWVQLKGGMPPAQVRDMTIQKRENDLVLATFGRGFYILDDYSALREISAATLAEEARLFPLRDASLFNVMGLAPAGSAGLLPHVRKLERAAILRSAPFSRITCGRNFRQTRSWCSRSATTPAARFAGWIWRKPRACGGLPGTCAPISRPRQPRARRRQPGAEGVAASAEARRRRLSCSRAATGPRSAAWSATS